MHPKLKEFEDRIKAVQNDIGAINEEIYEAKAQFADRMSEYEIDIQKKRQELLKIEQERGAWANEYFEQKG